MGEVAILRMLDSLSACTQVRMRFKISQSYIRATLRFRKQESSSPLSSIPPLFFLFSTIDALKVILMNFPSVEYNFVSDDGRMVSHSRYESKVFGSGWFNADGRVVLVPSSGASIREDGRDVVKVSAHPHVRTKLHTLEKSFIKKKGAPRPRNTSLRHV